MIFKWIFKILFILSIIFVIYYINFLETERYESETTVLLKDLGSKQTIEMANILLGQTTSVMQDSKVLEIYIRSFDMFNSIDQKFNLSNYFTSNKLDFLQRLYKDALLPFYRATKENILKRYNENINVIYDDPSGTLKITFIHSDPKVAKKILEEIIKKSEEVVNKFSKETSEIALEFMRKQIEEKKILFAKSIRKLIEFQNIYHTIDPSIDVKRKLTILTELETELVKTEVEYASKIRTFNPNSREIKILKENISNIKKSIKRIKDELSGKNDGKELNINVFEFELLKNNMEFNRELYKQTLMNMEKLKSEVAQQAKHLIIITKPSLPDDYRYPNKIWDTFTILIILIFAYSVIYGIILIISNHRD